MKKRLLFAFAFAAGLGAQAQTYTPVTVSGFTADVVANGAGTVASSTSTDADGASYAMVAQNYVNPSNQSPTSFLPNSGTINSAATTGLSFQLAPYTGNNSLRIAGTGTGTLTFTSPQSADQIYVLATSGSGISTVTMTVNFTDATTQVFTGISISDWYNGTGFAIQGISRVSRADNTIENSTTNPRLYQPFLALSAGNVGKSIQSITFNKTSTTGVLNVMGVSIRSVASSLATDAGVIAVTAPNSGCVLSSQETITVTIKNFGTTAQSNIPVSYKINSGAVVSETFAGPLAANSSANYSFTTKANLSTVGTYAIEARTNLTGDLLATNDALTKNVILSAAPAAPTITAGSTATFCTGGSVVLTANSSVSGVTYQWFNNGTAIAGATGATYAATTAGSYTVAAALNGCAGTPSAATVVTVNTIPAAPSIGVSGTTNFCAGGSVTLTALSGVTGGTYAWFLNGSLLPNTTTSTFTATASGNYTVAVSQNGCNSPASSATTVTVKAAPATPTITRAGMVLTSSSLSGNQWYKNGTILTGQTARTYTVTSNGAYTVIASANGCASAASAAVNITNTGINDEQSLMSVQVQPNPSAGLFYVTLPEGKAFDLRVTDLTGKVIQQKQVTTKTTQIDLHKTAKGIYLLKLVSEGKTATRKLVVE